MKLLHEEVNERIDERIPLLRSNSVKIEQRTIPKWAQLIAPGLVVLAVLLMLLTSSLLYKKHENAKISSSKDNVDLRSGFVIKPTPRNTRLPTALEPIAYRLKIQPYFPCGIQYPTEKEFTFDAQVSIDIRCVQSTNNITLHGKNLQILSRHMDTIENLSISSIFDNPVKQQITFFLEKTLLPGMKFSLNLNYTGVINKMPDLGLFKSGYMENGKKKWIIATQFEGKPYEPPHARDVVPCFDEPAYKATWDITVIHPAHLIALSNQPVVSTKSLENGWSVTTFEQVPLAPSYVICFAIGDFVGKSTKSSQGIQVRSFSWPAVADHLDLSLETAAIVVDYYGKYLNYLYPLKKLDLLGLPEFAGGAFENWGLAIFKYEKLIHDPNVHTTAHKADVVKTVCHEIAHQWFGNLATMRWWDDTVLSEGLAAYFEYFGARNAYPQQRLYLDAHFVEDALKGGMEADFKESAHPVHDPLGPDFGPLTYDKGASLLHMIKHTLGEETFKRGLHIYLQTYAYSSATYQDFFESFTKAAKVSGHKDWCNKPLNVTNLMRPWVIHVGFPLVKTKTAWLTSTIQMQKPQAQWILPLWYKTHQHVLFVWSLPNNSSCKGSLAKRIVPIDAVVNPEARSYIAVDYDKRHWKDLILQLKQDTNSVMAMTRAKIVTDLVYKGMEHLDVDKFLDFTLYMRKEYSAIVWSLVLKVFRDLTNIFYGTDIGIIIEEYKQTRIAPMLRMLDVNSREDDWNSQVLTELLTQEADYNEWNKKASSMFQIFYSCQGSGKRNHTCINIIKPDIRHAVFCVGIREGNNTVFDTIWKLFLAEKTQNMYNNIENDLLWGLCCTKEENNIKRLLSYGFTKKNTRVFECLCRNELVFPLLSRFLSDKGLKSENSVMFKNVLDEIGLKTSTKEGLDSVKKSTEMLKLKRNETEKTFEMVTANILWRKNNEKILREWFNINYLNE